VLRKGNAILPEAAAPAPRLAVKLAAVIGIGEAGMERIAVERLRVGLWVSMEDVPGTGFLLRSEEQIATFAQVGVSHVWHEPARSEAEPLPELPAALPGQPGSGGIEIVAVAEPDRPEGAAADRGPRVSAFDDEPATAPPGDALDAQRQSLDRCERRFSAVSKAFRNVLQNVRAQPEEARAIAETEIGGMVRAMRQEQDVAIRLLSEKAGQETALHAINVSVLSVLLARAMGHDEALIADVGLGALLHDVGKIELPDVMRGKAESNNPTERRMFQSHVEHSRTLAERMGLSEGAAAALAQHHEASDGSGYPLGLKGEALHPAARVVALVNHYDNLCNPPNPIHALTPHDAIAGVYRKAKEKFDPAALNAFVRMMGIYPPGSVLHLSDGRFALSVAVDPANAMKPKVIIHDPAVRPEEALVVALAERPELSIQRAIKPMALPRAAFDYLQPRKRTSFFIESRARRPG
jgi:putative nucleotidyltransferase with HDIG domain